MVEAGTIVGIAIGVIIVGIIGFVAYKRISESRAYSKGRYPGGRRVTPDGEQLEDSRSYPGNPGFSRKIAKLIIPIIVGVIVVAVILASSIKIVEAGNRGVLIQFGAVDTTRSLPEGLHLVTPFRDNIVQVEVRTLKTVESAASASKDLQDVRT